MELKRIILSEYCNHYNIETSFITGLEEMGIVSVIKENGEMLLDQNCLEDLERCRQLHYELHINPEGIDVILNLLDKQRQLREEIQELKNRLRIHE